MKQLQYLLKTYNKSGEETFRLPFYIEENCSYRTVLLKMIDYLRDFNFEIKPEKLCVIIGTGDNQKETHITLERVN